MRIALATGGGDAPGLNAVIRGAVLAAAHRGWAAYGIRRGFHGLLANEGVVALDADAVSGITHLGGTILGTTNLGDPFCLPVSQYDGHITYEIPSAAMLPSFPSHRCSDLD